MPSHGYAPFLHGKRYRQTTLGYSFPQSTVQRKLSILIRLKLLLYQRNRLIQLRGSHVASDVFQIFTKFFGR